MPHFYFHIYDGDHLTSDATGLELDDLEAAKAEGQKALLDMAKDKLPDDNQRTWKVNVSNEAGQVMLRIALGLRVDYDTKAQDEAAHG